MIAASVCNRAVTDMRVKPAHDGFWVNSLKYMKNLNQPALAHTKCRRKVVGFGAWYQS
jgi:hypothetical protein